MDEDISTFLIKFDEFLSDIQKKKILEYNSSYVKAFKAGESKTCHGSHYNNCSWSHEAATEGPDTCGCIDLRIKYHNIEELIKLFNKLKL